MERRVGNGESLAPAGRGRTRLVVEDRPLQLHVLAERYVGDAALGDEAADKALAGEQGVAGLTAHSWSARVPAALLATSSVDASATLDAAIEYGGEWIALNETEGSSDRDGGQPGLVGRSIDEFVAQLRGFTERARSLAGATPSALSLPALPSPPGALSAAQVAAVAQTVTAQRQQIAAMSSQLEAFDKQLAVFERILEPLVAWSSSWARLEKAVGSLTRGGAEGTSA